MTAVLTPCCAWLLWRWLLRVPSLCDDGVGCEHESPVEVRRQACKLHTRWRWCCRRAQQPVSRGIGGFAFGVCLAGARITALIPPSLALIASYGVTYALARVLERSHGAHCRAATTIAATAMTAWMASGRHAVLAAIVLSRCQATWLWWPPKGSGSGVRLKEQNGKWQVIFFDQKGGHPGSLRKSKRLAEQDKAAVLRVALSDRAAFINRLRGETGAPTLKRNAEHQVSSTSTPAKTRRLTLMGGAKSPRAGSTAGTPARTPARTPRTPHGRRNVYMICAQSVYDFWQQHKRGPKRHQQPEKSSLANLFAKRRSCDLSAPKYAETRQRLATIQKLEADARDWELADAPVAATEQRMQAEHDAWCRGQRRDPEPRPLLRREAGKHAYPGLLNLGQTCYLGSVIQCLIHCGAARAVLQDQPAAAPQDGVATLPLALQSLAAECVHGVSLPADAGLRPDFRAGVDLYSPHAVIDVFADVSGFVVGSNYDACEALQLLFQNMAPLSDILHASSALTV